MGFGGRMAALAGPTGRRRWPTGLDRRLTLGADKRFDSADFVAGLRGCA